MLTFNSWHEDALSFGDLPTMRDVLLAADPALVADALHRRCVRASLSSGEQPPSLARVWGQTEAAMGEMLGTPVRRPDDEGVLMAATTASWDPAMEDALLVGTEANLVRRDVLPLYARYLGDGPVHAEFSGEVPPNGWAFELCSWEEVLAYRAWVPERMCEREAYQFVADVVWEMTLFGDDRTTAEERRTEFAGDLERQVAEVEEALAYGRIDEATVAFDPSVVFGTNVVPEDEHDFTGRMYDIEAAVVKALRRDFYRDCVDLASRLA